MDSIISESLPPSSPHRAVRWVTLVLDNISPFRTTSLAVTRYHKLLYILWIQNTFFVPMQHKILKPRRSSIKGNESTLRRMGSLLQKKSKLLAEENDSTIRKPKRTNSWDRAVVFDPRENIVEIRKKSEIDKTVSNGERMSTSCDGCDQRTVALCQKG
jgi:hypothetical protein